MSKNTSIEGLYIPGPDLQPGLNPICDPSNSALRWLSFGRLWLPTADAAWQGDTGASETCLALFQGSGVVELSSGERYTLGPRRDPFLDPPFMLYLPTGVSYRVSTGLAGLDAGVVSAPASPGGAPLLFTPDNIARTQHGAGRWARKIFMGITADNPIQRLMVGETLNKPGGWTSYPPHKHDEFNPPQELPYEEIYFFLLKPKTGFAIQRIYDPPSRDNALDVAIVVHDGDTAVLPRGFHPVSGAPGFQMYYLWMMCGEVGSRTYGQFTVDPNFAWLAQVEPLLE